MSLPEMYDFFNHKKQKKILQAEPLKSVKFRFPKGHFCDFCPRLFKNIFHQEHFLWEVFMTTIVM